MSTILRNRKGCDCDDEPSSRQVKAKAWAAALELKLNDLRRRLAQPTRREPGKRPQPSKTVAAGAAVLPQSTDCAASVKREGTNSRSIRSTESARGRFGDQIPRVLFFRERSLTPGMQRDSQLERSPLHLLHRVHQRARRHLRAGGRFRGRGAGDRQPGRHDRGDLKPPAAPIGWRAFST